MLLEGQTQTFSLVFIFFQKLKIQHRLFRILTFLFFLLNTISGPDPHSVRHVCFSFVLLCLTCFACRYYCAGGAVTPSPTDGGSGGACPEGHFCPEGTAQPVPCHPGTYVAVTHASVCEPCEPGWYCVSGTLYLCPAGWWFFSVRK